MDSAPVMPLEIAQAARIEDLRRRYQDQRVLFVGVDLHKDSLTAFGVDLAGQEVFCEQIATKCRNSILAFFTKLKPAWDLVLVAVESVGFYQWFWDLLRGRVDVLILANASQVRAAAGKRAKTDRNDAERIAQLLRDDRLPTAFVPDPELREFRDFLRHRMRLSRRITSCKNSLRMEMGKLNLPGPRSLDTGSLHKWKELMYDRLPPTARLAIADLAAQLQLFETQILIREDELRRIVEANPRFQAPLQRIDAIPGIGLLTAAVLYAETGGLSRFDTEGEISCYAGLVPRVYQSADSLRHGKISKAGPPILRKCLIQAAWTAVRECAPIRKLFDRAVRRMGRKRAIVRVARKLLVWAWAMEKHQTPFDFARIAA